METERFLNKIVLITGGARGIGKAIVRAFAREKARVIFCDVNQQEAKKTQSELRGLGLDVNFLFCDLSKKNAASQLVRKVVREYGRLDVLVNNARFGKTMPVFEESEDSWAAGIAVDLKAGFFSSQEAIQHMFGQEGGGCIVNISSTAAQLVCQQSPVYHIAKAGVVQMTRYFAVMAGPKGIRVNSVSPGFIVQDDHKMRYGESSNAEYRTLAEFSQPLGRVGTEDEVASAVLFLCSSEAAFISGQCLSVDGAAALQEQSTLIFNYRKKMNSSHRKAQ